MLPSDRGEAVRRSRKSLWRVVESYLTRWRVEETIRFVKQSYQLEDIRLLSYERLRSMATLVMAAAYFACVHLGETVKLTILLQHIYKAAKRIYGVPEFRFYAIADGIKKGHRRWDQEGFLWASGRYWQASTRLCQQWNLAVAPEPLKNGGTPGKFKVDS